MSDLQLLSMINNFPIGGEPKNRTELLSKAVVISFLSRFQEQFSTIENVEEKVKNFLSDVLVLEDGELLPSMSQAESTLELSSGFLQDYNKIQYIKENNPDFDKTYDIIANNLGLNNELSRKAR